MATSKARDVPRRWPLFGLNLVQTLVFGTAAVMLPWGEYPLFAALTALLAVGHALTAAAAARPDARFSRVWRSVSLLALLWLFVLTWSVATSAIYLARIYGDLGMGIAAALAIGWCIPVLVTVPTACWSLASTPPLFARSDRGRRRKTQGTVVAAILVAAATWHKLASASTSEVDGLAAPPNELASQLRSSLPDYRELVDTKGDAPPLALGHLECKKPVSDDLVSVFLQMRVRRAGQIGVETQCVQRSGAQEAFAEVGRIVRARALRRPIKVDVVTGVQPLGSTDPLLDGFKLRPGLDGICDEGKCFTGWQLVAREMVNENAPFSAIPELRMGFEPEHVRRALGSRQPFAGLGGLTRITTESFVYDGQLVRLSRMHRAEVTLSRSALSRADNAVQEFLERQLLADGRFRYRIHPFSGAVDEREFDLPRQAGTTLALCELGARRLARKLARRSLDMIATLETRVGERSVLVTPPGSEVTGLGDQALPLSALLTCRSVVGRRYDKLIGRLGKSLLGMQRAQGDFYPDWDIARANPREGPPPIFAPGQAVLALVLMEKALLKSPDLPYPSRASVSEAIDRAMRYYGTQYWDHPLGKLFYVEENWHCLAARAALDHHRNDAYERFCIEHTDFKSRFVIGKESPTADMVGAFALAPMIPPPNTATAGIGEILAATIAIKRARHEDTRVDEERLRRLLTFVLRQQWDESTCFACKNPDRVVGGFSDSMLTPSLRIDFSQHAWSALRHGGNVLGLADPPRQP